MARLKHSCSAGGKPWSQIHFPIPPGRVYIWLWTLSHDCRSTPGSHPNAPSGNMSPCDHRPRGASDGNVEREKRFALPSASSRALLLLHLGFLLSKPESPWCLRSPHHKILGRQSYRVPGRQKHSYCPGIEICASASHVFNLQYIMEAGPIFFCALYARNDMEKVLWFYWSDVTKHTIQYIFKKRGSFLSCEVDRFTFHPIYYIKKKTLRKWVHQTLCRWFNFIYLILT